MNSIKKTLILLAAATAFSCSDDKQAQQQQNLKENQPTTVQQELSSSSTVTSSAVEESSSSTTESSSSISNALDAKVFEKIQTFYSKHIFGDEFVNDSVIAMYCTKSLAKELSKAYDKVFSDGGGYAVWKFRSDAQDGENIHEIEKIEPLDDGKYLVHYNDMGEKGTHTISTVIQNGEVFFDKLD